ncbi:hypothetical protein N9980_00820 [bacterium]|nr:hypothetical protein [bacterium]
MPNLIEQFRVNTSSVLLKRDVTPLEAWLAMTLRSICDEIAQDDVQRNRVTPIELFQRFDSHARNIIEKVKEHA